MFEKEKVCICHNMARSNLEVALPYIQQIHKLESTLREQEQIIKDLAETNKNLSNAIILFKGKTNG